MKKRYLIVALALIFILALVFVIPAFADDEYGGYKKIYSKTDLRNIANDMGGSYVLMNDIDMAGEVWDPLGRLQNKVFWTATGTPLRTSM